MTDQWYYSQNGQQTGPISTEQLRHVAAIGQLLPCDLVWRQGMAGWTAASQIDGLFVLPPPLPPPLPATLDQDDILIRRIADYERISGGLWLAIAIIQILLILPAIAGIWNIFVAVSRFGAAKKIKARDPSVPSMFEPIAGLIVIGVINALLGGIIGIIFVGFDFYVRDKVLTNAHLFQAQPSVLFNSKSFGALSP